MFHWFKGFLQVAALYGLYALGNGIRDLFQLALPGSVIGMMILFFLLAVGLVKEKWLHDGGGFLLTYLPLLFIPALAGVVEHVLLIREGGWVLLLVVVTNTMAVMTVATAVTRWLAVRMRREKER